MSGASGSGAPPPSGVVQNSALAFVASAQAMQTSVSLPNENSQTLAAGNLQETNGDQSSQADRLVPLGLKALCEACGKMYPEQPNPLQVTTRLKYWLGGEDPLDYISMYWNPGKPEEHIPPHWHYISFGLSDLHGDGRVHPTGGTESGYGFELTFRLESTESQPPLWPAQLCQALARYVFTTGNKLCAGDHVSWHRSLEGAAGGRLRHLLVAPDATIAPVHTPHGKVLLLQIVGCTSRELKAAQRGSGFQVLKQIANDPNCGGSWLVTRMRRRVSARCLPRATRALQHCPLAGVEARLCWTSTQDVCKHEAAPSPSPGALPAGVEQQIKDTLQRGLSAMSEDSLKLDECGKMSTDSFEMSSMERALPHIPDTLHESWGAGSDSGGAGGGGVRYFDGVHIVMNAEGASLLPLAIDARVGKGAHFTWRCGAAAVTLAAPRVRGALASERRPFAARDYWLQVVIPEAQAKELSSQVAPLSQLATSDSESDSETEDAVDPPKLPLTITSRGLTLTVLPDSHFL